MEFIKTIVDDQEIEVVKKEEYEAEKTALETKTAELQAQLDKELEKEKNFSQLRQKTKETEAEKTEAQASIQELKARLEGLEQGAYQSTQKRVLEQLAGSDEKLKEKILTEYNGFAGETKTPEEVQARMLKAAKLAGVGEEVFYGGVGISGGTNETKRTENFADSERGKEIAKKAGMKWAQDKK